MARIVYICMAAVLALMVAGVLTACGRSKSKTHEFTLNDNGRSVNMSVGDRLQITLPDMDFEGYRWRISAYNRSALELVRQGSPGRGAVRSDTGGAITEVIVFEAKAPGEGPVRLEHYEKESRARAPSMDQTYSLEVTVHEEYEEPKFTE